MELNKKNEENSASFDVSKNILVVTPLRLSHIYSLEADDNV